MSRLLSVKELSERWNVSAGHLYNSYKNLGIPHTKIGRSVRFRLKDIIEFENSRRDENLLDLELQSDNLKAEGVPTMGKSHSWNFKNGCSIYQQPTKNGGIRFKLSFYDNQGKRRQRVAKDAKNFEQAFQQLQQKLRELAESSTRKRGKTAFNTFADEFMEDYVKAKRRNWKSDSYRMKFLKDYFRNTPLDEIKSQDVRKFKKERMDLGNAPSTVNRYLALMKKMFNYAIKELEILDRNPVVPVKMESEEDQLHEKILTADEEERLIDECNPRLKPIIIIAVNTGMRKSEISKLKWEKVDLINERIIVEKTKSSKVRIIPMNDAVKQQFLLLMQSRNGNENVFPFKSIRTAWENARTRAKIKIRFHDLRHSFATRLVRNGADIITVKEILGHSSLKVTQRYTHACNDRMRDAVNSICSKPCSTEIRTNPESHLGSVH